LGILALAALWVVQRLTYQQFSMSAESMAPTLIAGDHIVAAKYPYGYSRYSLPLSPPLFSGRIFGAEPSRGDVVVFRLPADPSLDYVKRVVGLPGDRVQMIGGALYLNGTAVKRERLPDVVEAGTPVKRWQETLPNGASYVTLDLINNGSLDNTGVYTVPPGQYFMLGDNRDNSMDSRTSQVGIIPFEYLIGRVDRIIWSTNTEAGGAARPERIWMRVR
jgi:signal peptidase I